MNPSWISAAGGIISALSVIAHFWIYAVNRQCERRMQTLETRMVHEVQEVKDWVLARFVLMEGARS